jgi:Endonuclease/Exonuclease/phosphatase family
MRHAFSFGRMFFIVSLVVGVLAILPPLLAQDDFETFELRVMTFNVWVGGELVDFGKVIEAIQLADADVVGLQEAGGNTRRIAEALGWQHVSERMQVISRFPLIDPPDGDGVYILVQTYPGQVVAMANVHLPSDPYGPYMVRDGAPMDEILQNEIDLRLAALERELTILPELAEQGVPVLMTGDFNAPSHLDWTEAMTAVRDDVPEAVAWPVSLALEGAGFVDTYRAVHPDPVARVGMTWTPGYPVPRLREGEVVDRIDQIHAAGNVEIIDSQIVGELGGEDVDIGINPYPSDHRGVVTTVRVVPAEPDLFAAVDRRVIRVGDPIVVRYHAPAGENSDRLVILPADGVVPDDVLMSLPPMEADFFGAVTFGSAMLAPGEYAAALVAETGEELSRAQFWVLAMDAVSQMRTTAERYAQGEPITVEWENAPGNRWDWIGIYAAGESDLYNYWGFLYTDAASSGTVIFDAEALGETMLPAGEYEVRLMRDDWYVVLANASFSVGE